MVFANLPSGSGFSNIDYYCFPLNLPLPGYAFDRRILNAGTELPTGNVTFEFWQPHNLTLEMNSHHSEYRVIMILGLFKSCIV